MKHGCTVTAAAAFIAGLGLTPPASAECNPRNPTACTADSKPAATAPLQLERFIELGPARQSASRTGTRRAARKPAKAAEPEPDAPTKPAVAEANDAETEPLAPKTVPTVSIAAPPVALAPAADDGTVGFAPATEPWTGANDLAWAEPPATAGVTIAKSDEVNAIDLAADETAVRTDGAGGVSLVKFANATPLSDAAAAAPRLEPAAAAPTPESAAAKSDDNSWFAWLYGKLVDSVLTAALAIRSIFV